MKKIYLIFRYIKYLIKSKNEYFIHSPFVFDFLTKVIYQKGVSNITDDIEKLRKSLQKNNDYINITDFGAGSSINNKRKRKIKDIAKNSSKNKKYGQLLFRIVNHFKPKNIYELGTSFGISTLYLHKGNPKAEIKTFEGCRETGKIAISSFKNFKANKIDLIIGDFKNTFEKNITKNQKIDFAFIDGNHQEKATINYFETIINYSNNKTIIIFDDIHWSKGMENAWNYIKKSKNTSLTIDLFFIGIVFLDPKLSKENYIIRF